MGDLDFERIFSAVRGARVAVLGDFCVDHYLFIDPEWKETSVATGLAVRGLDVLRHSPGGAGNVAANLVALGVESVHCVGCIGPDPYGIALVQDLSRLGCDTGGLFVQEADYVTRAYVKPYVGSREESRLDHGVSNRISPETAARIVARMEKLLPDLDAVILNQQVPAGVWCDDLFDAANSLAGRFDRVAFIVDSRDHPDRFGGMVMKLNANEAARIHGRDVLIGERVTEAETDGDLEHLFERISSPVVITSGENGAAARDASGRSAEPGVHFAGEIDSVGAGDAFTSALASSLGVGLGLPDSISMANLAAAVTVRKLRQTGTATGAEIRELGSDVDYVYEPELAETPRRAAYVGGLDVEVVNRRDTSRV